MGAKDPERAGADSPEQTPRPKQGHGARANGGSRPGDQPQGDPQQGPLGRLLERMRRLFRRRR